MIDETEKILRAARSLLNQGFPLDQILAFPGIPSHLHDFVRQELEREQSFVLAPVRTLVAMRERKDWLHEIDRSSWYYWPTLRQYLIDIKRWDLTIVRSLEDSSDRILRQLEQPSLEAFDIRGLVLGFVQSGKTASYTAVIAKAADAGYRLTIVLSGIDNGLRRQTNLRLKRELVGYPNHQEMSSVELPPVGKQWHEFTRAELEGDFQPGYANHAALQGAQPVLLVVKKNGHVLRRLLAWLDQAPANVRQTLPLLVIDDEADQASIDTRGDYFAVEDVEESEEEEIDPENEPSVINGLIRQLLGKFQRRAYVAYTATPFANILIPHNANSPDYGSDLYPKDFIVDLPKPEGYFGAEEIFGRMDEESEGGSVGGLDIICEVPREDLRILKDGLLPDSLRNAIFDFVLAGSARAARGHGEFPATMLIHTSHRVADQARIRNLVESEFRQLRDEWRYQRDHGIHAQMKERWEQHFRHVSRVRHLELDAPFATIEPNIGPFFELVIVREVNYESGDVLDYESEPRLKVIAIGGNRLSRGLTLEGLLVSYFLRRSVTYDTLLQMGRWFGYRRGHEDLTRIHTTKELREWFTDLAYIEYQLREDLQVYENVGLKPIELGMRILQHPTMQVTSPLKRRFAISTILSQSYDATLQQTFKFPLRDLERLAWQTDENRRVLIELISKLGPLYVPDLKGPLWTNVPVDTVLRFLEFFHAEPPMSIPLIHSYVQRLAENGKLTSWTVAIRGREKEGTKLGVADWNLPGRTVFQIERSRIGDTDSLGVITSSEDELCGLSDENAQRARELGGSVKLRARELRPETEGLLLLYPISRFSGLEAQGGRRPLFSDATGTLARDLIGLALSFPKQEPPQSVRAFLEGTNHWKPAD